MKALPKIFITCFACLICFFSVFSQDSTGTTTPGTGSGSGVLDNIIDKLTIIIPALLALYEVIARLVPTVKDITLVNNILNAMKWIMDKLIPNKIKGTDQKNS